MTRTFEELQESVQDQGIMLIDFMDGHVIQSIEQQEDGQYTVWMNDQEEIIDQDHLDRCSVYVLES